jgi:hypothetical protein
MGFYAAMIVFAIIGAGMAVAAWDHEDYGFAIAFALFVIVVIFVMLSF